MPPQNAATLRLQLWLVQNAGWVAFDDLTVEDWTVAGADGSTKYYSFNGQRIAMRQGNQLTYLHTDRGPSGRGSTKLLTDQAGNPIQSVTQYYAYGREHGPGSIAGRPTDYTFTGQRQDNTGLIYMNARYYDRSAELTPKPGGGPVPLAGYACTGCHESLRLQSVYVCPWQSDAIYGSERPLYSTRAKGLG